MDSHNIGRDRGGVEEAAGSLIQPVHVVGIDSDNLYPVSEQQHIADLVHTLKKTCLGILKTKTTRQSQ